MIFIDSDVFVIHNFYTDDTNFDVTESFLNAVQLLPTVTTIFNLLEI